jgi:hypothetical protein
MDFAEQESLESQLASLEKRLQRVEGRVQLYKIGSILLAVSILWLLLGTNRFGAVQAQSQQSEKLRLRELDIVDEKGRERIVIAAPLPEAVVDGKVGHRVRVISAAVQFKATNGNEQGGIALSDDGSMIVGIDDERGHERAHLYYLPKRGSGVFLTGESGKDTVSLLLPNGGGAPSLEMTDKSGRVVLAEPRTK